TMPVGSTTVADARRQLILKTFASADGDVSRTAKLAGVSAEEVRREILALLDVGGSDNGALSTDAEARIARKNDTIAAARGAANGERRDRHRRRHLSRCAKTCRRAHRHRASGHRGEERAGTSRDGGRPRRRAAGA